MGSGVSCTNLNTLHFFLENSGVLGVRCVPCLTLEVRVKKTLYVNTPQVNNHMLLIKSPLKSLMKTY